MINSKVLNDHCDKCHDVCTNMSQDLKELLFEHLTDVWEQDPMSVVHYIRGGKLPMPKALQDFAAAVELVGEAGGMADEAACELGRGEAACTKSFEVRALTVEEMNALDEPFSVYERD